MATVVHDVMRMNQRRSDNSRYRQRDVRCCQKTQPDNWIKSEIQNFILRLQSS